MKKVSKMLAVQAAYDLWADEYNDEDPTTVLDEPFVLSMLEPFSGCRILDLGCGTGRYLRRISRPDIQLIGLDLSCAMLARAKRKAITSSPLSLVQAMIGRLPFAPNSVDRVIAGLVLDHISELSAFFQETAAILRPDGRLLVSAVHPEMQHFTGSAVRFSARGREHATSGITHTVGSIIAAARGAGFFLESVQEPRIDHTLVARYPAWSTREGRSALVLLAGRKSLMLPR